MIKKWGAVFLFFGIFLTAGQKPIFAADISSCRNTSDYNACWTDTNRTNCAFLVNGDTQQIDTGQTYCQKGGLGKICKFKKENFTCQHEGFNPVQSAVTAAAQKNWALNPKKTKWEVFMEPGNFTVDQKFVNNSQSSSGFWSFDLVTNQWRKNTFLYTSAVMIPSYTSISGALVNNDQESYFYMTNSGPVNSYCTISRDPCVSTLFTLSNVYSNPDYNVMISDAMNHPVHDVTIQNIHFLGVDGPNNRVQTVDNARRAWVINQTKDGNGHYRQFYCSDDHCYYHYTALLALESTRVAGENGGNVNVKILHNKMEDFSTFLRMGTMFANQPGPGGAWSTFINIDGSAADPIEIRDNYMDQSWGADQLAVWGSYINILNNTIKNSHNDWPSNPSALSVYVDSKNVNVNNNTVDSEVTGVNFEDIFADDAAMINSGRMAENNRLEHNTFTNTTWCMSIQRQGNIVVNDNYCAMDKIRGLMLYNPSFYGAQSALNLNPVFYPYDFHVTTWPQFYTGLTSQIDIQHRAEQLNSNQVGTGILLNPGEVNQFTNNWFIEYPRMLFVSGDNDLPTGMHDTVFWNNISTANTDTGYMSSYNNTVNSQPWLTNNFFGVYWPYPIKIDTTKGPNYFCNSNQFNFYPNQIYNVVPNQMYTGASCYMSQMPNLSCTVESMQKVAAGTQFTIRTANISNAARTKVYYSPVNDNGSWKQIGGDCIEPSRGNSCLVTLTINTPGTYNIVCNAFNNNYSMQCTGNPISIPGGWYDCGPGSRTKVTVTAAPVCTPACSGKACGADNGCGGMCVAGGGCTKPPTISNISLSSKSIVANGTDRYTITVTGTDISGGGNINKASAEINLQGTNAGAYRGYFTWGLADLWPAMKDHLSCTGGGYAVIQTGNGDSYVHMVSCSTAVSGNSRTTSFVIVFNPSFTTPTAGNSISGAVANSANLQSDWVNYQLNFTVCATAVSCSAQGKNCGSIADGCGTNLNCGTCTLPKICGGGGIANVCGNLTGDLNGDGQVNILDLRELLPPAGSADVFSYNSVTSNFGK